MNYSASKYNSKEWAIFCQTTNCYILFGTKKEMTKKCKELNKEIKPNTTLIHDFFQED